MPGATPDSPPPRCTVIVPTFNRAGLLGSCLDALLCQPVASEPFEIVVVDDGSTDDTPAALELYAGRIRTVRRPQNGGFAQACNDGAAHARGELLVFLNNDALPAPGWLDALLRHADQHPTVGVVGSVLLYPDGSVQHAGTAIGLDGYPRHLYVGFPADHPAIRRQRTCQAATAASMLVRRTVFDAVGGFDTAYRNGLEDVELCAQAGRLGWKIQVCPESVARHLESVSPGRFLHDRANVELYRARWHGRLRPDELDHYVRDGLLRVEHDATYPLRLWVSPYLGVTETDTATVGGLLAARARQVHALLRALVDERLKAGAELDWASLADALAPTDAGCSSDGTADLERQRHRWLQDAALESRIATIGTTPGEQTPVGLLAYRAEVARTRQLLSLLLPPDAVCLVISRGDPDLVELRPARGWHFPLDVERETYAGSHPADGAAAVAHLTALRQRGATHLAIPRSSRWWLQAYPDLAAHLRRGARLVLDDDASALLYDLRGGPPATAEAESGDETTSRAPASNGTASARHT